MKDSKRGINMDISIKNNKKSFDKIVLYFTMAVYAYILMDIILVKSYVSSPMELFSTNREMLRGVNLVPFKELWVDKMSSSFNRTSIYGNIALFIPLGMYITMFVDKKKLSIVKKITIIALVSLSFELFQYIFSTGITDINDLILNTGGGILGIGLYNILKSILKEEKVNKLIVVLGGIVGVMLVVLFTILNIAN